MKWWYHCKMNQCTLSASSFVSELVVAFIREWITHVTHLVQVCNHTQLHSWTIQNTTTQGISHKEYHTCYIHSLTFIHSQYIHSSYTITFMDHTKYNYTSNITLVTLNITRVTHLYSQSHLGWHFRKLKAQSSNVSFATFQWKEAFKLWALSFETAFENVTPGGIGCNKEHHTCYAIVTSAIFYVWSYFVWFVNVIVYDEWMYCEWMNVNELM